MCGGSISVALTFQCVDLDANFWCVDFGNLKSFKSILEDNFDHTCLIAEDDPELPYYQQLHSLGVVQLRVFPEVGCEVFERYVAGAIEVWLKDNGYSPRVQLAEVSVTNIYGDFGT